MKRLMQKITTIGFSGLGNMLLTTAAITAICMGITLTTLYVLKHAQETPEMIKLQCVIGFERPECVDYQKELDDLSAQRAALAEELAALKRRFSMLEAIQSSVDTITLFETVDIDGSDLSLTIGSVYRAITEGNQGFESYFCYLRLNGEDSVDRSLYIRNKSTDVAFDTATLRRLGVSQSQLAAARAKCQPMLIGGA